MREQPGHLASARQPHRTVVLTMHDERRRTNPRQILAHVGLVDQGEQIGRDFGVGGCALDRGEGGPVLS